MSIFLLITRLTLFSVAFTPLIYTRYAMYPYIGGKLFFMRTLIEIALAAGIGYFFTQPVNLRQSLADSFAIFKKYLQKPLFIALLLWYFSLIISTIFAINPYRAFWGNLERAEGLITLLHYGVFMFLAAIIFTLKDWKIFFGVSIITAAIVIFYGYLQYLHIDIWPHLSGSSSERPGSFIGNPAFFSAYLILMLIIAVLNYAYIKKQWQKILLVIFIITALVMMIFAKTRSIFIGLGLSIFVLLLYLLKQKYPLSLKINSKICVLSVRVLALALIIFIVSSAGIFWFTKNATIWQSVPILNRFAQTSFDKTDPSTQTRIITWGVALEAFKEKPIFGWGLEGFGLAHARHYNPEQTTYGETWLDRAHNKLLDIAVMQGILGVVFYIALWLILIIIATKSLLIRRRYSLTIAILLGAYFIYNLLNFDDLNGYIFWFAIIGFCLREKDIEYSKNSKNLNVLFSYKGIVTIFFAVVIAYMIYVINYVPYIQTKYALQVEVADPQQETENFILSILQKTMYPYNFVQSSVRSFIFDMYYLKYPKVFEEKKFEKITTTIEKGLRELSDKEPNYEPRFYIRESQLFNSKAHLDSLWYQFAEKSARQGLSFAPKRQELYYGLIFALIGQEKFEEAINIAKYAVSLNSRAVRAWFHLGIAYAVSGNTDKTILAWEEIEKLKPQFNGLSENDTISMFLTYRALNREDKIADLIIKKIKGRTPILVPGIDYYSQALHYYIQQRNSDNILIIIQELKKSDQEELRSTIEILEDLLQKKAWDILDQL